MKNRLFLLIFFSIIFNIYLNTNKSFKNSDEIYFWCNLLYWLNIIPLFIWIYNSYKKEIYPFFPSVSIFLLISFALPPFFIATESYQLGTLSVETLQLAFLGFSIFYFSYYFLLIKNIFQLKPFDPIRSNLYNPRIKNASYVFLFLFFLSKFITSITALHHIGELGFFIYIGTFIVLLNQKAEINLIEKLVFYAVILSEAITRALDGLLVLIGLLILFIIVVNFFSSNKKQGFLTILLICLFIGFYLIMSPIKDKYRVEVWYSNKTFTLRDRISVISELYSEFLNDKGSNYLVVNNKSDKDHFVYRYSYQASALSLVLESTPQKVPYWNGKTYIVFSKFIPRVFWEDKPTENLGQEFGHRYGILNYSNKNTSMNTPLITEMYMNYGKFGVYIGMILLAFTYLLLNNIFNNNKISTIGRVYSISIIFPFISQESNFTLTFGNIPLMTLAVYLIIRFYINSGNSD